MPTTSVKTAVLAEVKSAGDTTRQTLLEAALEEIHQQGFQAASLSKILSRTGLSKGALYHHFPNKKALGYAVVDELIRPMVLHYWLNPIKEAENPIDGFIAVMASAGCDFSEEEVALGCPLNNLAQEMSSVDEGFRERLEAIYQEWRSGLSAELERGQNSGFVDKKVQTKRAAIVIVAILEGCIGQAKNSRSLALLHQCGEGLIEYLNQLRV
ncbi:MAG: TetR/AcrR family transcriptional regulator [Gammaproteobacteria bacterium]|nr:TetR/AcrR family transcriptional regulator [Gammaproteobacteria bacterium]